MTLAERLKEIEGWDKKVPSFWEQMYIIFTSPSFKFTLYILFGSFILAHLIAKLMKKKN